MQVEAVLTKSDAPTVAGAIASSYGRIVGHAPPSRSSIILPLAQSALETDHWRAMWNYNAGNVTSGSPATEEWLRIPTTGAAGKLRFRAYRTLREGTDALVDWLHHHGAIAAADAGDVVGFVGALQKSGYAGSDPKVYGPYRDTLGKLAKEFADVEPRDDGGGAPRRWAPAGDGEAIASGGRSRGARGLGLVFAIGLGAFGLSRVGRRGRA